MGEVVYMQKNPTQNPQTRDAAERRDPARDGAGLQAAQVPY